MATITYTYSSGHKHYTGGFTNDYAKQIFEKEISNCVKDSEYINHEVRLINEYELKASIRYSYGTNYIVLRFNDNSIYAHFK